MIIISLRLLIDLGIDTDGDGTISRTEAEMVTSLDVTWIVSQI